MDAPRPKDSWGRVECTLLDEALRGGVIVAPFDKTDARSVRPSRPTSSSNVLIPLARRDSKSSLSSVGILECLQEGPRPPCGRSNQFQAAAATMGGQAAVYAFVLLDDEIEIAMYSSGKHDAKSQCWSGATGPSAFSP